MNFYELLYAGKNSGALSATYYELLFAKYLNPGGGDEWAEYDGALPAQYTANGDYLADYRIYGASGGVGDRTENLFDKDAHDTANGYVAGHYINSAGTIIEDDKWDVTEYIPCNQQNVYCFSNCVGAAAAICWYDSNKNYISGSPIQSPTGFKTLVMSAPINASYIRTCVLLTRSGGGGQVYERNVEVFMVNIGSTVPASYVPYGYEVDMVVSDSITATTTPIYIGSDPLEADEYVDYGGDKIYRKTDNLIPVPEVRKLTDGELTVEVTDGGEWRYTVSNVTRESRGCIFDVTPFTFPQGTSWGGDGVFKLWYGNGSRRISISFLGDDGSEDIWIPKGSGDNIYHALAHDGEFLCTKIKILAEYGQTPISGFLRPMLVNTGIDPQTFVPHVEPEDPPVPLPVLPTFDGTTIVDYVGQSVAPSRFYAKYKKR